MLSTKPSFAFTVILASIIISVVAIVGTCTYFVVSSINQNTNKPLSAQVMVVPQTIPETKNIVCPEVNQNLEIKNATVSFNPLHLVPIETNVNVNLLPNDTGILVFKQFNGGGALYSDEKNKNINYFGGEGPYYVAEILNPTSQNTSLVPSIYLPEEIGAQMMGLGVESHSLSLKNSWFFLSLTGCEMGCSDQQYKAEQKLIRVTTNKNTVQVFTIPSDIPALDQTIGHTDTMIIFSSRENTTPYVGFDSLTNTWKKLSKEEVAQSVLNTQSIPDTVKNLIRENRCFSYATPGAGTIVFTHHTAETTFFNMPPDDYLLDIYFDGNEKQLDPWKK